jgi:mono/diheme cytochrome c family protein
METPKFRLLHCLAALVLALTGAACSDDSKPKPADAGTKMDTGNTAEVAGPEVAPVDLRPADLAPAIDVVVADAPSADSSGIDMPVADAPAADAGKADSVPDAPSSDHPADGASVGLDGGGTRGARGKYLVDHVIACTDCHTPQLATGGPDMTRYLAGNPTFAKLPDGSALPSANLTPDPTGLGNYTDEQVKHMFMDGITPQAVDGGTRALNPAMPYYVFHNMTSDDADAIVAYLRTIPPVKNELPAPSPAFAVSAPANYLDPTTIPTPPANYPQRDSALRGRYLAAESGLCIECHTPHPASGPNAIDPTKYFQGGEDFSRLFIGTLNIHPVSANLTSDPTTGLGDWTAQQIVTVLQQGKDESGNGICPPMPVGPNGAYGGLTAQDALDIANYIKSLPPAVHDVPDMCTWPPVPPAVDAGSVDAQSMDSSSSG